MHIPLLLALLPAALAAPLLKAKPADVIAGKYIVKLKEDMSPNSAEMLMTSMAAAPDHKYSMSGFRGWAGALSDEELTRLQASDQVEWIEEDSKVYASSIVEQKNATWGLERISHREPGSTSYLYHSSAGDGTCSYVIDTGIEVEHPEFQGHAEFLIDLSGENLLEDGMGHGTHVAGIIGSLTYGVAKNTKLFAVKVLDSRGSGENSNVIAGIQYVMNDAATRGYECSKGIVSNMSLGGSKTQSMNDAAAALVASGVFLAVAAGNELSDANLSSPASEPTVCTVGATDQFDRFAFFSNFGPRVDVNAPGVNVTSTWKDGGVITISGTSMASPHVAGLAAYWLGLGGTETGGLCEAIADVATKGVLDFVPNGTVNAVVFNGISGSGYRID